MVYATCRRILGSQNEAEDVAQECFATLAMARQAPSDYLGPWLHRVAANLSLKRIRADMRRRDRETSFAEAHAMQSEIEWDDIHDYVDEAIDDLPTKLRLPVVAHFLEGKSHKAIAKSLNAPRQTITSRIQKGISEIRRSLKKKGITVPVSVLAAMMGTNMAEGMSAALAAQLGRLALAGIVSKVPEATSGAAVKATPLVIGGVIMSKKALIGLCTVALCLVSALFLRQQIEKGSAETRQVAADPPVTLPPPLPSVRVVQSSAENTDQGTTIETRDSPSQGVSISGAVVDSQGNPIEAAYVRAQDMQRYKYWVMPDGSGRKAPGNEYRTMSGMDGSFELSGMKPSRKVRIEARKEGMLEPPGSSDFALTESGLDVVITLYAPAAVEGIVVDGRGRPVGGREVLASYRSRLSQQTSGMTDAQGRFRIAPLLPGTHSLVVIPAKQYKIAYHMEDERVEVQAGETLTGIRLVYEGDGLVIAGRVTNERLEPIEGATIDVECFSGPYGFDMPTDADGRYRFLRIPEGKHQMYVYHAAYEPAFVRVRAGSEDVDFVLAERERTAVMGRVVDADTGEPITHFEVVAVDDMVAILDRSHYGSFKTVNDAEGHFILEDVLKGPATIFARAPGYGLRFTMVTLQIPDEYPNGIVVELPLIGFTGDAGERTSERPVEEPLVEGIVLTDSGQPVPGAFVFVGDIPWIQSSSMYSPELVERALEAGAATRTHDDGTFRVGSLTPERQIISAYHPDEGLGAVEVLPDRPRTTGVRIVLSSGGSLEGRVTRGDMPVDKAHVIVGGTERTGRVEGEAFTGADGTFKIEHLLEGVVGVTARLPQQGATSRRELTRHAEIAEGQMTELSFNFSVGSGVVEGVVSFLDEPVERGTVHLNVGTADGEENRETTLDPDSNGCYCFENVPAGLVSLRAMAVLDTGAIRQESVSFDLEEGETVRRNLAFSEGSLVGMVGT